MFAHQNGCSNLCCDSSPTIVDPSRSITGGSRGIDDDVHGGTTEQDAFGTHIEPKPLELAGAGAEGEQQETQNLHNSLLSEALTWQRNPELPRPTFLTRTPAASQFPLTPQSTSTIRTRCH